MKQDKHLTQEQRHQVSSLLKATTYQGETSRLIDVDKSTIRREIKRNKGKKDYRLK